ncbi:MAG: MarR family transcriptional regulator [Deltaproteobacteria bacterium]|nr:MarR family transcriptional regulator [Deltaproteobacteria bacterium]MBW2661339.1 MarR family transcriptional regulator [Deltaproteobacteria bacterium]
MTKKKIEHSTKPERVRLQDDFFETLEFRILRTLRRIIRAVDIHSRKLNIEFKITAPQMICLYLLARQDRMTLSELAKEVSLGVSTVNGIVDRLERKELLTRNRSKEDRRKVFLEPTDAGRELINAAPSLLQNRFSESLKNLPELEQAAIALSLERVVELMEEERLDALPDSKHTT